MIAKTHNSGRYLFTYVFTLLTFIFFTKEISSQESMQKMESKRFNFEQFSTQDKIDINKNYTDLNSDFSNHPEYGLETYRAPCENCFEVLGKRKLQERYFVDADDTNRFYVQKGGANLHHQIDGQLITIDHRLKNEKNKLKASNFHNTFVFNSAEQKILVYDHKTKQSIEFNDWSLYGEVENERSLIAKSDWSEFSAGDDGVKIYNIFPDIDAEFITQNGAIKTNFIIKSNSKYKNYKNLWFEDKFTSNSDISFDRSSKQEFVGEVNISNDKSDILNYGEGFAFAENDPKYENIPLHYKIEGNSIFIKSPVNWINEIFENGDRVVIDPIVTGTNTLAQASITGSQYNASCGFDNSCDHNLTVQAPPNATFDDVTWSFEYIAQNGCWLDEGATRFSTGNCISPNQAGFFWFCNQSGGGTCAGQNISVWDDLGGCLPPPSCQSQNVDFTLHFYRRCYGPTGCNNNCIGANSPWTMTIHGRTIEYSNVTNPITVSSNNICQGEDITATTNGENGVPPYTYEWSFDPTGNPVIATGASANITFPNDGNITLYSIVTDACGNEVIESTNITVTAAPQLTVTATEIEICDGESTTLEVSGGSGTYDWDNGLGSGSTHTVSPSTTTTYNVSSTAGSGCQGFGTIEITVNPIPTVDAGPNQEVCEGDQVTLSASGSANNYSWDNNVNDGVPFTPPVGSTTFTLTGESLGCEDTDQVEVNVIPDINFDVTGIDPSVCNVADGQLEFSNLPPNVQIEITYEFNGATVGPNTYTTNGNGEVTVTDLAHGNYSNFEIEFNNCTSQNNSSVELINPSAPTVQAPSDIEVCEGDQVTLSATASSGATISWSGGVNDGVTFTPPVGVNTYTVTADLNNCTDTDDVTVEVFPEVNFNIIATDPTACGANDGSLLITGLVPNDDYTITFTQNGNNQGPNSFTANGQGEYEFPNLANETFTNIEIESDFGCSNIDNGTYTIQEAGAPTVIAPNDVEICIGEEVTLTAQNPDNAIISWDNNVNDGAPFNPSVGTITYTVTADLNNCISTDEVEVTVYDLPNVDAGDDIEICQGESVTLTATGAQSYQWTNGVVNNNPFTPTNSNTYTVTGTSAEGCINTDEVFINIIPTPSPEFTSDIIIGCEPLDVEFTSLGNYTDCVWNFGDGNSVTGCNNVSNTYTSAGIYNVTLTATENGCEGSNTVNQLIEVTGIPNASFTTNTNIIDDENSLVEFQNNSSNASDYFWDFGDGEGVSTSTNPTYEYDPSETEINQEFEVMLYASNGDDCIDSASTIIRFEEQLIYYVPNAFTPDGNKFNEVFQPVFTSGFDPFNYNLTIFNRWGEVIFESNNAKVGWDGTYGNMGIAPNGVYIWKIEFKTNAADERRVITGHVTLLK